MIFWLLIPLLATADNLNPPTSYPLEYVTITLTMKSAWEEGYTVLIHGNGDIAYSGLGGDREDSVARSIVGDLVKEFYKSRFFDLRAEYNYRNRVVINADRSVSVHREIATDQNTVHLSIQIGSYWKGVSDIWGAPHTLHILEEKILKVAGIDEYGRIDRTTEDADIDVVVSGRVVQIDTSDVDNNGVFIHIEDESGNRSVGKITPLVKAPPPPIWKMELYYRLPTLKVGDRIFTSGRGNLENFDMRTLVTPYWSRKRSI